MLLNVFLVNIKESCYRPDHSLGTISVFASYKHNLWVDVLLWSSESLTWLCTRVPQVDP